MTERNMHVTRISTQCYIQWVTSLID